MSTFDKDFEKALAAAGSKPKRRIKKQHRKTVGSHKQACSRAIADYKRALGKTFAVSEVDGYEDSDSTTVQGDIVVKVLKTSEDDVCHGDDEYIDPYWNVEVLSGPPRALALRSTWVYGPTYKVKS